MDGSQFSPPIEHVKPGPGTANVDVSQHPAANTSSYSPQVAKTPDGAGTVNQKLSKSGSA